MPFDYNPLDYAQYPTQGTQFGAPGNVNREFFGEKGSNWKDSTAFAYSQLAEREKNALNIALMNYQNDYNSPFETMKRYQAAGINPFDAVGHPNQSAQPAPGGAAHGSSSFNQETAQKINFFNSIISGVASIADNLLSAKKAFKQMDLMDSQMDYNYSRQDLVNNQVNRGLIELMYLPYLSRFKTYDAAASFLQNMYATGLSFDDLFSLVPTSDLWAPGSDIKKHLNSSPFARQYNAMINLRNAEIAYKKDNSDLNKAKLEFAKKKWEQELEIAIQNLEERKRHNKVIEGIQGAGAAGSVVGKVLKWIF